MYKKIIALCLSIVIFCGALSGCSLIEDWMNTTKEDISPLPRSSPMYTVVFVESPESIAEKLSWMTAPRDTDNMGSVRFGAEWDDVKELNTTETVALIGFGSKELDGLTMFVGTAEYTRPSQRWVDALLSANSAYMLTFEHNTAAAKAFFGKKITMSPVDAIKQVCGIPSVETSDTLLYVLDYCNFMITIEPTERGTYDITIVQAELGS